MDATTYPNLFERNERDFSSPCRFCHRRCRVPVTRHMPQAVQDVYAAAHLDCMCTCVEGAAHEARLLGASYADVIMDRVHRASAPPAEPTPEQTREQAAALRALAEQVREGAIRLRARNDQTMARTRDVLEDFGRSR